jgi:hypothetical protein
MPRRCKIDEEKLAKLLQPGCSVATHAELQATGVPRSTITFRIGVTGPWQRILPGVVLAHRGTPTMFERRLAAQKYGGEDSVITGLDALAEFGVRSAKKHRPDRVHVLINHKRQRTSHGFALVTRTRYLPNFIEVRGLRCAAMARALVDACRQLTQLNDVRELVADVVQKHGVKPTDILLEVKAAARQRTALARAVLREISAGIRSVAEARLREIFEQHGVPAPLWNAEILTLEGDFVARPDGLWQDLWVAVELDSMAWHLSPEDYRRTQERQRDLTLAGIEVIPIAPSDVLEQPEEFCSRLIEKLSTTQPKDLPLIVRPVAVAA